jgi:hypothetical protein
VLRAARIDVPEGLSGQPLQDVGRLAERQVLVQHPFYQPSAADRRPQRLAAIRTVAGQAVERILVDEERVGLVGSDWKYLRTGDREELYRLAPEADERTNRIDTEPEIAARMRDTLKRQLAEHPLNVIDSPEINEELLETLRALGYL